MTVKIIWEDDRTGLNLKPTWIVEAALIHTVRRKQSDDTLRDVVLVYFKATAEQLRKLVEDYGRHSVPLTLLGLDVFELEPNKPLWTWKAPPGYEKAIKDSTFYAFRIVEVPHEAPVV